MSEKKERSPWLVAGLAYLLAAVIGSLIGTAAYFATATFSQLEQFVALLRKIESVILEIMKLILRVLA